MLLNRGWNLTTNILEMTASQFDGFASETRGIFPVPPGLLFFATETRRIFSVPPWLSYYLPRNAQIVMNRVVFICVQIKKRRVFTQRFFFNLFSGVIRILPHQLQFFDNIASTAQFVNTP
jgi:hypothetical protein